MALPLAGTVALIPEVKYRGYLLPGDLAVHVEEPLLQNWSRR